MTAGCRSCLAGVYTSRLAALRAGLLLGVALCALGLPRIAAAVDATPPLPTPALEHRYLALTNELRCMQCQDESLANSTASLAGEMRLQIRNLLLAGDSDQQILNHFVSLYGEFILFKPPMNWRNAWLWGAPGALMLVGAWIAVRVLKARRSLLGRDGEDLGGLDGLEEQGPPAGERTQTS